MKKTYEAPESRWRSLEPRNSLTDEDPEFDVGNSGIGGTGTGPGGWTGDL